MNLMKMKMKRISLSLLTWTLLLAFCALLPAGLARAAGTAYYVSQSGGDDANDGRAANHDGAHGPWKTLAKASAVKFVAGDQLLLNCGDTWHETLTLHGDGATTNPIVVTSYGVGERPSIQRTVGEGNYCVVIDRGSGYRLADLDLGFAQNAIRLVTDSRVKPVFDGYQIENCFLHDITNPLYPDPAKKEGNAHLDLRNMGWAIFLDGFDSPQGALVKNLSIRNCVGLRTQAFFIQMGAIGLENILFDSDTITHSSYNAVYQAGAKNYDMLHCVFVYGYPWEFHPMGATQVLAAGLVGDATTRNEVVGNEFGWAGDYPGCPDGCGYDFEGGTSQVTFQNNFIHDTYGEAVLFMGGFKQSDLLFDNNLFRRNARFSSRWDYEVTLNPDNTGSGTLSRNTFFPVPGKRAINSKPACFKYVDNNENATGTFVEMPLVARLVLGAGSRTYTLASKTPGATIRYTLDGSLPTTASTPYTGPVTVKRAGVLNAKAFKSGNYPSYVNSLAIDPRETESHAPSAWWKLDETTGTVVADAAGGKPGALAGGAWTGGKIANGLEFKGVQGAVALSPEKLKTIADTFTITFWADANATRTVTTEANSGTGILGSAWWKLDEMAGDMVEDSAGGGNPGTLTGCAWSDDNGHKGLRFNGASDSVTINNAGLRPVAGTFTISFWADAETTRVATPEATDGISGIAGQRYALAATQLGGSSGEAGLGISVGTNGVSLFELADNHFPSPLVADRPLTGWNQITVVYRDNQPALYVNGAPVKTGLKSAKKVRPFFSLGGSVAGYGWYKGQLSDVRVFSRALDNAEIEQLARGQATADLWRSKERESATTQRFALAPVSRGGGPDANHAGVGVSVGVNGISVCESSDNYLPSLLVDDGPLTGWNHITVVYRNQQPTLYVNGIYEKAGCKSKKTVHPVFNLGGLDNGWYSGKLDDVRVYDRALTDAEIQVLASGVEINKRQ